ncbi:glycosyltransferase family 4 protein [Hymenobacter sp. PAMC 26628]|uniref:glycosyltransferase family 4 protein n=1 Tax=Hymenobacter sp. PAMC 26628 TaxID=1484118 RepID=UPI00077001DF|nr:glycosyltransferase family 4 protein [Hymenobacter sp. PAMC 26628]AMJ67850.1 hypothetical protein AXW84_22340 [Hymenobacter sp. PAMC 26628]
MKVLYVCSEFYAGLLPFATSIVNIMQEEGNYGIFVCTPQCDYRKTITSPPANCEFIDFPRHKLQQLRFRLYPHPLLRAIDRLCQEQRIEVIHLLTEDTALALHLSRLRRYGKVLYAVHDLFPHPAKYRNAVARFVRELLVKQRVGYLIRRADNLVTCSRTQYEWMAANFPAKRVFFHDFPTLVTNSIAQGTEGVCELKETAGYILFFGRIEQYKGIELLYDAYLRNDDLRRQPLVIAGSGHVYFERDVAKEQNVIFINRYIEDGEVKDLFSKAACVVFPYTTATQSGVLSLAFYFRVPAVVSGIPFLQELITEGVTGFSFSLEEPGALAEKLREVRAHDPAAVTTAAYQHYALSYDGAALKNQLLRIYGALR